MPVRAAFALAPASLAAADDPRLVLLGAMKDELARSAKELKLEGFEGPYFVSYQLKDVESHGVAAKYGAVFDDRRRRDAKLHVDVRVGSYELDSSEGQEEGPFVFDVEGPSYFAGDDAPFTADPVALRNVLWLQTDEKYKQALSSWLKKKGQRVFQVEDEDRSESLTREKPVRFVQEPVAFPFDRERWRTLAVELSRLFRPHAAIFDSEVKVLADKTVRIQTNSEGSEVITEDVIYAVHVSAVTRAADGQLLDNSREFYATSEADLPPRATMEAELARVVGVLE